MLRPILLLSLLVTACGYTPPPGTNTNAPTFQADLESCDTSVPTAVAKQNAKQGLRWLASPITRWSQISTGMEACMKEKGWKGAA